MSAKINLYQDFQLTHDNLESWVYVHKGSAPILITAPHTGIIIPDQKTKALFVQGENIYSSHEASDIGVLNSIFEINRTQNDFYTLHSLLSRAYVDLNRAPDYAPVTKLNAQSPEIILTDKEKNLRMAAYNAYHDQKKTLIKDMQQQYGQAIVIDLHSFTPTFHGQRRDVEIGTLRLSESEYILGFEEKFAKNIGSTFNFQPAKPYDLREELLNKRNAARFIERHNGIEYIGLEISNHLLQDTAKMTFILNAVAHTARSIMHDQKAHPLMEPRQSIA